MSLFIFVLEFPRMRRTLQISHMHIESREILRARKVRTQQALWRGQDKNKKTKTMMRMQAFVDEVKVQTRELRRLSAGRDRASAMHQQCTFV